MPQIDEETRAQIAAFLPSAIRAAIASYLAFADEEPCAQPLNGDKNDQKSDGAKTFKAHHDACKVAIAHIDLLLKLARWAEIPEEDISQVALANLIKEGNARLGRE